MLTGTTEKHGKHAMAVSKKNRPATSGNKHVVTGGKSQMAAKGQHGATASKIKANLKGPYLGR